MFNQGKTIFQEFSINLTFHSKINNPMINNVLDKDTVFHILSFVDPTEVSAKLPLVCKSWRKFIKNHELVSFHFLFTEISENFHSQWKFLCTSWGRYQFNWGITKPNDWRVWFFKGVLHNNLIRNPRGDEGFSGWKIVENGGDGFLVENSKSKL